jgi:formate dehydrogenase iron-sulfur subunit
MSKGFFTDTTLCIGCKACEVACKQWNQLPADGYEFSGNSYDNTMALGATTWRHVAFIEQTAPPEAPPSLNKWLMMSDVCKHCTHAGCMEACPTGAIVRNEFDDVYIQPDVCNGCGYCVPSCPFGVVDLISHADYTEGRHFESDGRTHDDATQTTGGIAGKCTLCYDRQKVGFIPAFGDVAELHERAKKRVETLAERGVDSYLYGVDSGASTGNLNAFFLLTEAPGAYNLPERPVLPSTHQRAGYTSAALAAAALTAIGFAIFRRA